jgi:malonyl-CoA O-methyltransferase
MRTGNKDRIERNFTRAADKYGEHSWAQRECAFKLNEMVRRERPSSVLEIGPGTGYLTRLLLRDHEGARLTAVDISEKMAANLGKEIKSPDLTVFSGDGEYFDNGALYDLIISNAAFQWFEDLPLALERYARMLNKDGVLAFSIYGPGTFTELKEVISLRSGKQRDITADKFLSMYEVGLALEGSYRKLILETVNIRVKYSSARMLLLDIKNSGAQGPGTSGDLYLGKKAIKDMDRIFLDKYGGVTATHSVIFFKGIVKPDER